MIHTVLKNPNLRLFIFYFTLNCFGLSFFFNALSTCFLLEFSWIRELWGLVLLLLIYYHCWKMSPMGLCTREFGSSMSYPMLCHSSPHSEFPAPPGALWVEYIDPWDRASPWAICLMPQFSWYKDDPLYCALIELYI